jgi:hypothetical protein
MLTNTRQTCLGSNEADTGNSMSRVHCYGRPSAASGRDGRASDGGFGSEGRTVLTQVLGTEE